MEVDLTSSRCRSPCSLSLWPGHVWCYPCVTLSTFQVSRAKLGPSRSECWSPGCGDEHSPASAVIFFTTISEGFFYLALLKTTKDSLRMLKPTLYNEAMYSFKLNYGGRGPCLSVFSLSQSPKL